MKAARKVLEYLSATAHLGLTFRKESKLGDVQLEYDLETYVDADYAHKAEDRRSVSGVAVCCGGTLVSTDDGAWCQRYLACYLLLFMSCRSTPISEKSRTVVFYTHILFIMECIKVLHAR